MHHYDSIHKSHQKLRDGRSLAARAKPGAWSRFHSRWNILHLHGTTSPGALYAERALPISEAGLIDLFKINRVLKFLPLSVLPSLWRSEIGMQKWLSMSYLTSASTSTSRNVQKNTTNSPMVTSRISVIFRLVVLI